MAPLGPFAAGRPVMAAVSGGADSMALALLLSRWGQVRAAIVDHGLRPESAAEAERTARLLAAIGVASTILPAGLARGPAAAERARDARYRLLLQACRAAGCPDLFVAHHEGDQAETVQMRHESGIARAGLAGMAPISYRDEARLLRPLLSTPAPRLRATLRAAGLDWVEDPSNHDLRTRRARLRAEMDPESRAGALAIGRDSGIERARAERRIALELTGVAFHPAGFALISDTISDSALSALIWTMSGQAYPPPRSGLSAGLSTRSVHGVLLRPGGRLGASTLLTREPDAVAAPVAAAPGVTWDGRFRIATVSDGLTVGARGSAAARIGRRRQSFGARCRRCGGAARSSPCRIWASLMRQAAVAYQSCSVRAVPLPARPSLTLPQSRGCRLAEDTLCFVCAAAGTLAAMRIGSLGPYDEQFRP
jgi:tRNA(Ile)-lysidine synthase